MTKEQIEQMLNEMDMPYRYHHFTTADAVDTPFLIWNIPEESTFYADGVVFHSVKKLEIELYTDERDWDLEWKLEHILKKHDIAYKKTASEWLQDESMWECLYEMEV